MFDKLEDLVVRFNEILEELNDPTVVNDQDRFRKLMKEQSEIEPIVTKYREYKKALEMIEDAELLLEESDKELRALALEELSSGRETAEKTAEELKILLLPKDPNDEKNVIVEIRAGTGGEEAALFASVLYRMYTLYAESKNWKTEIISVNETELGGF